jgi:biotin carboxyl carrier protein
MRYTVQVAGESIQVEVRDGAHGPEVRVGEGEMSPARLVGAPAPLYQLEWGQERAALRVEKDPLEEGTYLVSLPGRAAIRATPMDARTLAAATGRAKRQSTGPKIQRSAMPGVIVEIRVEAGQEVAQGDLLVILEAMKMQNEIRAQAAGVVAQVHVETGDSVPAGAKLVEFGSA